MRFSQKGVGGEGFCQGWMSAIVKNWNQTVLSLGQSQLYYIIFSSSSSKWPILTERSIEHIDMNLSLRLAAPLLLILLLIPTTSPLSPLYSLTHSCTHCNNILTLLVSASFSDVSTSTSHSHRSGILGQASDNHLQWVSSFPSKSTSISPKGHQSINQTSKGPLLTLIPWLGSSIC